MSYSTVLDILTTSDTGFNGKSQLLCDLFALKVIPQRDQGRVFPVTFGGGNHERKRLRLLNFLSLKNVFMKLFS